MLNQNLLLTGDDGYNLTKSLRFRSSASAALNRTVSSGTASTKGSYSVWVKRGKDWDSNNNGTLVAAADTYNYAQFYQQTLYFGGTTYYLNTAAVFRDPASWYHVFFVFDTTLATSSDRLQIWVNGVRQTAGTIAVYPTQNSTFPFLNSAQAWYIGGRINQNDAYFDGEMAELNYVDGQALTPSSFGETDVLTGVWKPKKFSGTYGTNGFYLPFTNTASTTALGYDFSGNSNNWTTNNFSISSNSTYDSMADVPTLTSATTANYSVLNPLTNGSYNTISNANLKVAGNTGTNNGNTRSTVYFTTGKWYIEMTAGGTSASTYPSSGIIPSSRATTPDNGGTNQVGYPSNSVSYEQSGSKRVANSTSSYGSSYTTGDVIGIAIDADNGAIYFSKNGTFQNSGVPTSGASKTGSAFNWTGGSIEYAFATAQYNGSDASFNFGQQGFVYTPPTGFVALNTFNLPTSTIVKGNTVMDATTYTGNGTTILSTQTISNGNFKPDFIWIKSRSTADYHNLNDSVRGIVSTGSPNLFSNTTGAEATFTGYGVSAVTSTGFTLIGNGSYTNTNGVPYVGWQWQAGQGTNTTNTAGSITSTVSVNASAGFSVVTYTGTGANATVGHGLGVAPSMVIVKSRSDSSTYWCVYQSAMWATSGTDYTLLLPLTNGAASRPTLFNSTQPSSTVFSIGTNGGVNNSGSTYVAYCWSEIAGFSKFGSYTGNGSTDGPFVYTGFRPKFVLMKATSGSNNWIMYDTVRNTYNLTNLSLVPDSSAAENGVSGTTENTLDILSNGFKLRTSNALNNGSSVPYIYMAFAENPFKNSLAR